VAKVPPHNTRALFTTTLHTGIIRMRCLDTLTETLFTCHWSLYATKPTRSRPTTRVQGALEWDVLGYTTGQFKVYCTGPNGDFICSSALDYTFTLRRHPTFAHLVASWKQNAIAITPPPNTCSPR